MIVTGGATGRRYVMMSPSFRVIGATGSATATDPAGIAGAMLPVRTMNVSYSNRRVPIANAPALRAATQAVITTTSIRLRHPKKRLTRGGGP